MDFDEFKELDRIATKEASKLGSKPRYGPPVWALMTALASYILLTVFAAFAGLSLERAEPARLVIVAGAAAAAYALARWQENIWFARYDEALEREKEHRKRRRG